MIKFIYIILLYYLATNLLAQSPQYYNYNTMSNYNTYPFSNNAGMQVQWLIRSGEFNHPSHVPPGKSINAIYFFMAGNGVRYFTFFNVSLGQTAMTSFTAGEMYRGPLTTVYYSSFATLSSAAGNWMKITLDTPFPYDTALSLVIDISHNNSFGSNYMYLGQTALTGVRRCWGLGFCPPINYSSSDSSVANCGIDVVSTPNSVYYWSIQNSGTTSLLYSVKAVGDLVGWAVGAGASIRRTTNGGITWLNGDPNPGIIGGDIYSIEAINADTAWCTTTPSSSTFIYRTTNRGENWSQVFSQEGGFINAIHFTGSSTGYAVGNPVNGSWSIRYTGNSGMRWDSISFCLPQNGNETGWNNSMAFVGNYGWFGTNNSRVYTAGNPHCPWVYSATQGLTNTMSMHLNSNTLGMAGGETLLRTTNGGLSWLIIGAVPGSGNIYGIEGAGSNFWYIRGDNIYGSTNSGDNWFLNYTAPNNLHHIDFSEINGCLKGWAVGENGTIVRMSTDSLEGFGSNNSRIPDVFKLYQNYPNPFNPVTHLRFEIPKGRSELRFVKLIIYDLLGREITTLVNEKLNPGEYEVSWDASNYPSGVYFYKLVVRQAGSSMGDYVETKKMVLIK